MAIFDRFLKIPYKRVSSCPQCGSFHTGYYFRATDKKTDDWVTKNALQHGEIVAPTGDPKAVGKICFCLDCDAEWNERPITEMLSSSEVEDEKKKRDTNAILQQYEGSEDDGKRKRKSFFGRLFNGFD